MSTPNDIETKVFSSSLRGYNKREVDEFLDQVMIDYQALMDQNAKMLERVHVLQKQVAEAKDPARMTQDAKRMMNDISASAEQKAEIIIKNAKHDAENIVRNAKDSTSQADEDAERLRRKVEKFKLRFKQMLEEEIDRVDDNSEDLLDDLREDFYPGMLYGEKDGDMTKVAGSEAMEEDPIAELPDVEPTGDIVSEDDLSEDQNPDGDEEGSAVSDETEELEEAPEKAEAEVTEEPEEEAGEEAEEPSEEEVEEPEEEPEAEEAEEVEETEEGSDLFEGEKAPDETIVIDKAALERAQAELAEQEEQDEHKGELDFDLDFNDEHAPDDELEDSEQGSADETLIIDKADLKAAESEAFQEYDDPDREEPVEEPEPETEEEQVAKYAADYAGDVSDDDK